MFIATNARPKISLLRSETREQNSRRAVKHDCAPTELRSKDKDRQAINISPL